MERIELADQSATAMLQRAVRLDPEAYARVKGGELFVTTPFGVVASRRARFQASRDGAAVHAAELLAGPECAPMDLMWPGALPPAEGFMLIDVVPAADVYTLATQGKALARQFNRPPKSLLDQEVLTVSNGEATAALPMRAIFALVNLGFIPAEFSDHPQQLRVSQCGRWTRVDAPFGTVYHSTGLLAL